MRLTSSRICVCFLVHVKLISFLRGASPREESTSLRCATFVLRSARKISGIIVAHVANCTSDASPRLSRRLLFRHRLSARTHGEKSFEHRGNELAEKLKIFLRQPSLSLPHRNAIALTRKRIICKDNFNVAFARVIQFN